MVWNHLLETHPSYVVHGGSDGTTSLAPTGPWSKAATARLWKGDVDRLALNYTTGFCEPDLDFIEPWPITELHVLDRRLADVRPITRLATTLRKLGVQAEDRARFDVSAFTRLESLSGLWAAFAHSFDELATLSELVIVRYGGSDLRAISHATALERLDLKGAYSLETVDGVERLSRLSSLQIALARKLVDIGAVADRHGSLRSLYFNSCPHLGQIDDVRALRDLRVLGITNSREIASLSPLPGLDSLETLHAWESTRIVDGDLSPLLELPALTELRMMSRRAYRPSLARIREQLAARQSPSS